MLQLNQKEAEAFYGVHKDKPFFGELTNYICSGVILVSILEGENAIVKNREIMGATNPSEAAVGTIRKDFASSITENTVHGSDAPDTAKNEIAFFFSSLEY